MLQETNAREFGFYLGTLFVGQIDVSLNPSHQSGLRAIRQATEPYADFFGVKEEVRELGGDDASTVLQVGFSLYHQCARHIHIKHGERVPTSLRSRSWRRSTCGGETPECRPPWQRWFNPK